jgi:rubrerythrin
MSKVKLFRCRICGDPYIGTEAPTRCPFCGAPRKYFVDAKDWNPNEFNVTLSEVTRKNLEAALKLELGNAAFYECAKNAAEKADEKYFFAKFKALMKVEREHAAAIMKFLKKSSPGSEMPTCSTDMRANTQEGFEREDRAIKSYSKFRDEATEPRLKEFFGALVEIETDHLNLHSDNLKQKIMEK